MAFVNLMAPVSSSRMQSSLPAFTHSNRFLLLNKAKKNTKLRRHCSYFPRNQEPLSQWEERIGKQHEEVDAKDQFIRKILRSEVITQQVESIKANLSSMGGGETSISAYDTAWVALVEDKHGNNTPQYPAALEWIAENQLQDGSWGDSSVFLSYDRMLCTLACVVALKSWNIHHEKMNKGITFIRKNTRTLVGDNPGNMTSGFEIVFPSLIELARSLGINLEDEVLDLRNIYHHRDIKLKRIPKNLMHAKATTLLFSLEAMPDLDWKKLLKLQTKNGSFLDSPSSTAYALMQTKNLNCYKYLDDIVRQFHGGVPCTYPIDMFERVWVVDRLQRLGISRYFQSEIEECINHVHRNWTERGITWDTDIDVKDIDITSNGFRLLRSHGRSVSSDVFKHFEKNGEFFCYQGQSSESVTTMHNLYRASQLQYSDSESILQKARHFSLRFLKEKRDSDDFIDKWVIAKDIAGEIKYAIDVPWYADLPRIEARFYIDQYGGEDDVWISKVLYRLPNVSNNLNLKLAMMDFNNCQALHRLEWEIVKKWFEDLNLGKYGASERSNLVAYFVAAANIFEPERSTERLAWAKTLVLIETIASYFGSKTSCSEEIVLFSNEFQFHFSSSADLRVNTERQLKGRVSWQVLLQSLLAMINELSLEAQAANCNDIYHRLCQAWRKWLVEWQEKGDRYSAEAELIISTIELCSGRISPNHNDMLQLKHLFQASNSTCQKLGHLQTRKVNGIIRGTNDDSSDFNTSMAAEVEPEMQTLVKLVLGDPSNGINRQTKQTFLDVMKSYYYLNYFSPGMIHFHIAKVLYERVS